MSLSINFVNQQFVYIGSSNFVLNNISNKNKIRRIYSFSGPNNSNILRWTPNDPFSQFLFLEPNKTYWIESLGANFESYTIEEVESYNVSNSFNIIGINQFLRYDCGLEYLLNDMPYLKQIKIRRIYAFSGSNNSNILRWTPYDSFSQFATFDTNKVYWIESLAPNFNSYELPLGVCSNSANYNSQANWDGFSNGNVTSVGSNGSSSYYDTYDQTGNVWEWNSLDETSNSRGIRGGSWNSPLFYESGDITNLVENSVISKDTRLVDDPTFFSTNIGFRVIGSPKFEQRGIPSNVLNLPNFVQVPRLLDSPNPLNPSDTNGYGSVNYFYSVGRYLVTNCEYVEFLNATSKSDDPNELYNESMSSFRGGIIRSGDPGDYTYSFKENYGDKPVIGVSWFSAARYCNWLHNNKPVGVQGLLTTENGAYDLDSSPTIPPPRNAGAFYGIPTENEWYKAAYYSPLLNNFSGGYWNYATQNNNPPIEVSASDTGNGLLGLNLVSRRLHDSGVSDHLCPSVNNRANYNRRANWNGTTNGNVTTVGTNGGPSAYGTYDQSGNVFEWVDNDTISSGAFILGGSFDFSSLASLSSQTGGPSDSRNVTFKTNNIGFRIVSSSALPNPLNLNNFVSVGDANNTAVYHGSVSYVYQISKYTITNCEYAQFLNAVAIADEYNLFIPSTFGGISRIGSNGSYFYSVKTNMDNKPVVFVNWFNAARYCNWLHNGKPIGTQNSSTTENGAYTLNGTTSGLSVVRNASASYSIPTKDEWHKAAFYKGGGANAGYWDYATQSDAPPFQGPSSSGSSGAGPTPVSANENGDGLIGNESDYECPPVTIIPPPTPTATPTPTPTPTATPTIGNNSANYNNQAIWGGVANVTTVGSNGRSSAYGTYDQSGNVWNWNDLDGVPGSVRGVRGGAWYIGDAFNVSSALRITNGPSYVLNDIGFRLASSLNPLNLSNFEFVDDAGNTGNTSDSTTYSFLNPLNLSNFELVDDANNTSDSTTYGAVSANYLIGKYSVTNCEYVLFLNSVDPEGINPQGIYNVGMNSDATGGITFVSGNANGSKYATKANMSNKPVVYVSWFDAVRYCNWLHNGALSYSTTDSTANAPQNTGAYNVGTATTGDAVAKEVGATYHIPTENQWYKAAYYKGGGTDAGYYFYATQSDTAPTPVNASETGDGLINDLPANNSDYVCPIAPIITNQALFDKSSWSGSISTPISGFPSPCEVFSIPECDSVSRSWQTSMEPFYKDLLDEASDRWSSYIKYNSDIYNFIQGWIPWEGNYLAAYDKFNANIETIAYAAIAFSFVDGNNSNKIYPYGFVLGVNDYYRNSVLANYSNNIEMWRDVLAHELGHALGIGTAWTSDTTNHFLNGSIYSNGQNSYNTLVSNNTLEKIPLENSGGPGTASGHWENNLRPSSSPGSDNKNYPGLSNELMIGFVGGTLISAISIKTLTDIGWEEVNPGSSEGDPTIVTTSQTSLVNQTNMFKHNCSCSRKFLKNPIPLNLN